MTTAAVVDQNSTYHESSTMDHSDNPTQDKSQPRKSKEIRELGAEMTNTNMQPFVNHCSSKSLLTMVPIATEANTKVSCPHPFYA